VLEANICAAVIFFTSPVTGSITSRGLLASPNSIGSSFRLDIDAFVNVALVPVKFVVLVVLALTICELVVDAVMFLANKSVNIPVKAVNMFEKKLVDVAFVNVKLSNVVVDMTPFTLLVISEPELVNRFAVLEANICAAVIFFTSPVTGSITSRGLLTVPVATGLRVSEPLIVVDARVDNPVAFRAPVFVVLAVTLPAVTLVKIVLVGLGTTTLDPLVIVYIVDVLVLVILTTLLPAAPVAPAAPFVPATGTY
jgi:hypothetical protein